jgi:hypothetical protein
MYYNQSYNLLQFSRFSFPSLEAMDEDKKDRRSDIAAFNSSEE